MNTITTTTEITIDTKPVRNKNAKSVYCISDGNIYASVLDTAIAENIVSSAISSVCRGKLKTANGKQFCFVKDMPSRILDISNTTKELVKDANIYRTQEAERKVKEAHDKAKRELEEKMAKLADELNMAKQMYEAMEKEFNV